MSYTKFIIPLFFFLTLCLLVTPLPHKKSIDVYQARVDFLGTQHNIQGYIEFVGNDETTTVTVNIVSGLDDPTIKYPYHIHEKPVQDNCTDALGHLSPNGVPDTFVCPKDNPSVCQEGDLSGKHGALPGSESGSAFTKYTDKFLKWDDESSTILGRSVVIHLPDKTRIACANIIQVS